MVNGYISGWWLLLTSLKNMSSSNGSIISNKWKNIIHVPNHQPDIIGISCQYNGNIVRKK